MIFDTQMGGIFAALAWLAINRRWDLTVLKKGVISRLYSGVVR
jgi:hypothetical protein